MRFLGWGINQLTKGLIFIYRLVGYFMAVVLDQSEEEVGTPMVLLVKKG